MKIGRAWAAVSVAVVAIAAAAVIAFRPQSPAEVPPPSSTHAAASPTPTSPAPATPSPTTSPSPTPARHYVSATMGYALDLTAPWHRSGCGSSASGPVEGSFGIDLFIAVADRDLELTDTGVHTDHVQVLARANPEGLTPQQWEQSGKIGFSVDRVSRDVTFAGRPALLVGVPGGEFELYLVANGAYMYEVSQSRVTGATSAAERSAIVRSFRFIGADEVAAARAAATPSPAPRSAEQVADALAEGFARRDVQVLARVLSPRCVSLGVAQGGGTAAAPDRYLETLQERFALGLTVDVVPRPIGGDPSTTATIRSTWHESGQPDRDVDLMIALEGQTAYWTGTVTYFTPRP